MSAKKEKVKFRCCVKDCDSNYSLDRAKNVSFFRIPDPERMFSPHRCRLTGIRLAAWDKYFLKTNVVPAKFWKICSKHFVSGAPARLTDTKSVDWIPSLCLPNSVTTEAQKNAASFGPVDYSKIVNSAATDTVYIKDGESSSFKIETSSIDPLKFDDRLNHFCRLCLRDLPNLQHIRSTINGTSVPDMLIAVAGINLYDQNDLPEKLCDGCLINLQTAYGIRKQFVEADSILREMAQNKNVPLAISLQEYQNDDCDQHFMETDAAEPLSVDELTEQKFSPDIVDEETFELESEESKPIVGKTAPEQNNLATERKLESPEDQIETKPDPNKWYICPEVFSDQESLKVHIPSHSGEKEYLCEYCTSCFRTDTDRKQHQRTMHADMPKGRHRTRKSKMKHHCEHCSERFALKESLLLHVFKHTGTKPFCCELCGKGFLYKTSLTDHVALHSIVRRCKCEVCGMGFVNERLLRKHLVKHSDGKNYQCRFCGIWVKYRGGLSKHESTHFKPEAKQEQSKCLEATKRSIEEDCLVEERS
ncbi:transcription factor Ouib-like [Sabethes cyaneus]|uniref:transcription factor Ouib-like n=1 Tax=Sabethes cyaneus TaxID=53552 RepID=UPI00237D3436|nr:transcription factor Ouib-like [Sabethes cyaneus]